ncbi:hypothetical protein KAW50_05695 [candidate division WOR-3 bacterium]|nr:hypothetical protein [candidate division WOR-3 bacterium]
MDSKWIKDERRGINSHATTDVTGNSGYVHESFRELSEHLGEDPEI